MSGAFCEQYGNSMRNRILENFLENSGIDIGVPQLADELKISRPKAYEEVKKLIDEGFVLSGRKFRGTQLYDLNAKNPKVTLLKKNFRQCLNTILNSYTNKEDKIKQMLKEQELMIKELQINHKKIVQMIK